MTNIPTDPMAFFREMVNQWETAANEYGTKIMGSSEAAQAMHTGTAMSLKAQQMMNETMAKGLATANMPSRNDIEAIGARLVTIEGQLARIEALLAGTAPAATPRPAPKRTKQPAAPKS